MGWPGEGDVVMTFKLFLESAKCILFLYFSASRRQDFVNCIDKHMEYQIAIKDYQIIAPT